MYLKPYRKTNDDTLYLDFAPVYDEHAYTIEDRLAVVVKTADGEKIGTLCVISPEGIELSYLNDSDERLDIFDTDEDGYYKDITERELY